jgi:hypothetical protein
MDENLYNQNPDDFPEESDLNHSDKAVGVITEPAVIFSEMSKYPPKVIDWLLPFSLFLTLVILSQVIQYSNPEIAYDAKQQQITAMEKRFDEEVKAGRMSREEAERITENVSKMDFTVLRLIGTFFSILIFFFLIAAIYFLFGRFVFKGEGGYSSALVSSGLPMYIGIIEVLVYTIAALVIGKGMANASVGSFMGILPNTPFGILMWLLNPFAIWSFIVVGIGLGKMFRRNVTPFIILTITLYILSILLIYAITPGS